MSNDEERPDVTATAPARVAGSAGPDPRAHIDLAELLPNCSPAQFELGAEIGRGGIGRVLRGRDPVFDRPIAIKELLSTSSNARARFLREAMITARLQHPAIVPVYLAGRWPDGSPFYGMKLVEGKPMSNTLRACPTLRDRMSLLPALIAACEAIAFAHRNRIIHRDLKPSNVLLGELGETVVIDWGLAKDLDEAEDPVGAYGAVTTASETIAGAVIGTPAYMPPEQGAGQVVDERGDVYSLGAILYELLAGEMPYAESKEPRAILAALADDPPRALRERCPDAPRDLIAIAERAMAREPSERYRDASELADDLRKFQTGQLVSVREYGRLERLARWIRKHRAAVVVGAAALVTLAIVGIAGFVGTVRAQHRAELAARAEAAQRAIAERQRDEAVIANAASIVREDPLAALAELAKLSVRSEQWSAARTIAADAYAGRTPSLLPDPGFRVDWLVLSKDEHRLAAGSYVARKAIVYDLGTGTARRFEIPRGQNMSGPSPDLQLLATSGDKVTMIRIADSSTIDLDTGGEPTFSATFSPDGAWVGAVARTKVFVWPTSGGAPRVIETPERVTIALDDAGTVYALDSSRRSVHVYAGDGTSREVPIGVTAKDESGARISLGPHVYFVSSQWVSILTTDDRLALLSTVTGNVELLPDQHERIDAYIYDEDLRSIVGFSGDRSMRWDRDAQSRWHRVDSVVPAGTKRYTKTAIAGTSQQGLWVRRDDTPVLGRFYGDGSSMAITRDGTKLFAVTHDGMVAQWDLTGGDSAICGHESYLGVADRQILQRGAAGLLYVCDPRDGSQRVLQGGTQKLDYAWPSTTLRFIVSHGEDGENVVWDMTTNTGRVVDVRGAPSAISNDGSTIIFEHERHLLAHDVASGTSTPRCSALDTIEPTSISEDATVAIGVRSDALQICDLERDTVRSLPGYPGTPYPETLSFVRSLVYLNGDAGPVLWNLHTNQRHLLELDTRDGAIVAELIRDDKGVVIAGQRFAAIFDAGGRMVAKVERPNSMPTAVSVSSDLRRVVTTDARDHAQLFDLDTHRSRILGGPGMARGAGFFDDDRVVVTIGVDGRLYRFADPTPSGDALRAKVLGSTANRR